ncbi:S8 family serine peptidase [Microcoleus sp. CAWBG50]|uniref:S8 family serine peptidase n=1 Tax=Microcoleus sp. CAWBG50 TaxID=2841646 RepID=UPI0025EBCB9D|nr:S8 family serine peptidase [Microcoleus sp. CAWBG50]
MLSINPLTPNTTTSTSIIPDITEKTQLGNITSTFHFPSSPEKNIQPSELDTIDICPELLKKRQLSVENNTDLLIKTTEIDALLIEKPGTTIDPLPKKDSTTTSPIDPITGNSTKSETTNNTKIESSTFTAEAKNVTVADITNSVTTLAEVKPNSSATETKVATVSEDSTNTKNLSDAKTDSATVETKNATVSEIPDSNATTADTTPEKCKCTEAAETKNTTVSEIPTSMTKPAEAKPDSSATDTKNTTVSEIPTSTTKPAETKADSPATDTKNTTKPVEVKPDSSATETKNTTKPVEVKADSSATDTKNTTVSEIPNSATKPAETKADSATTETKISTKPVEVKADSSATESKSAIVSETPHSATKPAEVKADSPATETKNTTNPAEVKPDSPATETKNATNPIEKKADSPVTETKNPIVAINPAEVKPDSPAIETQNPTVSTAVANPVEKKPDSPATETQNPTVTRKPVEKKLDFSTTETQNATISPNLVPTISENTQPAVAVINSTDEITGDKIEITAIPSAPTQTETTELPAIPAATDILTGEIENTSLNLPNTSVNTDIAETTSQADESFPLIYDEEISTLLETLNRTSTTAESTDNHPLSESEYTIANFDTDSENLTNIPQTATTQNYLPSDSANIIANTDNQPQTIIDEYPNPNFETDSEKTNVIPEIASSANNQPENPLHIIATSQSDSETKINDYPVADTTTELETTPNFPQPTQLLIGIIDTGFAADNPNIDYSKIILGKDVIDNDNNPLLQPNEGNQHGSAILEIIAGDKNQNNPQTPIWLGRATGSGNWHESLIEFVDAAKASKQPNAVVNLSFDLTQINPDGTQTTRHKLTETETAALKYAQENNILIVAAAGNEGSKSSALGQASTEFNNIITVGAASNNNRSAYSSYGEGLDILASDTIGSTIETATTQPKQGTSIAAALVTKTISQMWETNPSLNPQQIKNILLNTATDIDVPGWDERTGYGILNQELAIATAAQTIPAIPVLAATKQLIKPLISADENISQTTAKPSSRAALTNGTTNQPKTTTTSTGDYNVGTSSTTTELAPNTTSNTSKNGSTTSTNTQTNRSYSHTDSNWNKSRTNTNSNGNSFSETKTDTNTNTKDYTDKNLSLYSIERTDKSQSSENRLKYEGTGNSQTSSKEKWSSNRNYTSPSQTQKSAGDSYINRQTQSDGKHDGNYGESNSKTQEESGSKSTTNNQYTSSNGTSGDNTTTQKKGKTNTTSSSKGNYSNSTNSGENSEVTQFNSHSKTSSDSYKTNNSSDNRSITNNTWDNTTTNGKTVGSSTRDTYYEGNSNYNTSYDDGKSKNKSNTDTYTQNQSQETNSTNGTNSWRNNRDNGYSVTSVNNTDTYKNGGETRNHNRDYYSINKSNSSSSNSAGKPSSKNESENYSENQEQWDSEYKADTYTTKSNSDESTITASKNNSSSEGNNTNSSNSSDTSKTSNSQTVTTYKDGRKEESGSSSYEKWLRDSSYDSKGVVSDVYKYSSWTSSYTKSYFKGGYRWSETISGSDSESTTKRAVYTSSGSNWSWTRSGTVWDDGRNDWSESWSKSSWKDGKYLPSESESKRGGFDPKKTGQTNDLPKFGEAPRLTKAPKKQVPPELNKPPKPSKDIFQPISYNSYPKDIFGGNVPDNQSANSGAPGGKLPPDKRSALTKVIRQLLSFFRPLGEFVAGAVYQWLRNNGDIGRWLLQVLIPGWNGLDKDVERGLPKTWSFQAGRTFGDAASIVTGILEIMGGGGTGAGGAGLCVTGVGCIAGAPAIVAGTALGLHGATTASTGLKNIAKLLGVVFHSTTNGSESGGPSRGENEIHPDAAQLEADAKRISDELYGNDSIAKSNRVIAVGQFVDAQGKVKKVVSNAWGEFSRDHRKLLESQGYVVIPNSRGGNLHAEERMIYWADSEKAKGRIVGIESIGVSHPDGICEYFCRSLMQERQIRPGSRWNPTWKPGPSRQNEPPRR